MFGFIYSLIVGAGLYVDSIKNSIEDNKNQAKALDLNEKTYTDHKGRNRWSKNGNQVYTSLDNKIKDIRTNEVYYDYDAENLKRNINKALSEGRTVLIGNDIPKNIDVWNRKDINFVYDIHTKEILRIIRIIPYKPPKYNYSNCKSSTELVELLKKESKDRKNHNTPMYKVLINKDLKILRECDGEKKLSQKDISMLQEFLDNKIGERTPRHIDNCFKLGI